jgi:hypothetical protein
MSSLITCRPLLARTRSVGTTEVRTCSIVEQSPEASMAFARSDLAALAFMVGLVETGKLSVRVGSTFPLASAAHA